jgi:hypothetical protein
MTGLLTKALVAAAALGVATSLAAAQVFPDRSVKIIVPTAPGGAIDLTGRVTNRRSIAGELPLPVGERGRSSLVRPYPLTRIAYAIRPLPMGEAIRMRGRI